MANPTSGGVTASTEMLAAKRHAGVHTPVIAWQNDNCQSTNGIRSLTSLGSRLHEASPVGLRANVTQRAALLIYVWGERLRSQASGTRFLSVLSGGRERPGVMPGA